MSPDLQTFKCWRQGGAIIRNSGEHSASTGGAYKSVSRARYNTLQLAADAYARLGTLAGAWQYKDANDNPVMGVLRFNGIEGKAYRPFHMEDGVWVPGDPPAPPAAVSIE